MFDAETKETEVSGTDDSPSDEPEPVAAPGKLVFGTGGQPCLGA